MPRKPKPHPPIHSGDTPFVFEGDTVNHYHSHHIAAGAQSVLQACLAAIRGLPRKTDREAVIGHLLAALVQDKAIDGLMRSFTLAGLHINAYHAPIEPRGH